MNIGFTFERCKKRVLGFSSFEGYSVNQVLFLMIERGCERE